MTCAASAAGTGAIIVSAARTIDLHHLFASRRVMAFNSMPVR